MQRTESLKRDCFYLAVLAGVTLAVGFYLIAASEMISQDGVFYIDQAKRLSEDPLGVAQTYPIGYPALLFAAHKIAALFADGNSIATWVWSAQTVTLLCRVLTLIPLYLLGRLLVGARRSFWALLVLVVLPHPAHYGSDVLREWPFLLFLSLGFWLTVLALRDGKGWLFGLVGLVAGLGYLIRPMCGQLVIYALLGLAVSTRIGKRDAKPARVVAGALLLAGFAVPAAPYFVWTGTAVPHQFRAAAVNVPPVVTAVAGRSARYEPLRFNVGEGQLLEMAIEAFDPEGKAVQITIAGLPLASRPVYRLQFGEDKTDFWTISQKLKDKLLAHPKHEWDYVGVDYYAYTEADATSGLMPVHRFWSPVLDRHFYTISEAERRALLADPGEGRWHGEGLFFYAFGEGQQPPDAVPIYRFRDEAGRYSWAVGRPEAPPGPSAPGRGEADGVAWYGRAAGGAPRGSTLDGCLFRWRPEADQRGEHLLNIIVNDGERQTCQLVRISVGSADSVETEIQSDAPGAIPSHPGAEMGAETVTTPNRDANQPAPAGPVANHENRRGMSFLHAADHIFTGIAESLMVFFLIPLCLGFYHRLRHGAGPFERALMIAVVTLYLGLMLARCLGLEPGSPRRYSLGMVALTICYVPHGLERMAVGLRMAGDRLFGDRGRPEFGQRIWFGVLMAIGIVICVPKLLKPMHADKAGYRQIAHWLRDNTEDDKIIAVPDRRIAFYAERKEHLYHEQADSQRSDYVVTIAADSDAARCPEGWTLVYACRAQGGRGERLAVYRTR